MLCRSCVVSVLAFRWRLAYVLAASLVRTAAWSVSPSECWLLLCIRSRFPPSRSCLVVLPSFAPACVPSGAASLTLIVHPLIGFAQAESRLLDLLESHVLGSQSQSQTQAQGKEQEALRAQLRSQALRTLQVRTLIAVATCPSFSSVYWVEFA